jgi:hypothetical protein
VAGVLEIPSVLLDRRAATRQKLDRLQDEFEINELVEGRCPNVTVLATGSLGRAESGPRSDLDVFLIDTAREDEPRLSNLDGILLRADLIRAARDAGFDEFSRDGEYLVVHHVGDLLSLVGTREDDSTNAFTARMLLLLESRALFGRGAYARCVQAAIAVYSRDAKAAETFLPRFLINDIVRYWKTLCLNYEAKRHDLHVERAGQPKEDPGRERERLARIERLEGEHRLELLKLRFNRLWTCFNGLAFLLSGVKDDRLTKEHVLRMVELSPVERAQELAERLPETQAPLSRMLKYYAEFLELTGQEKAAVIARLADREANRAERARGERFGDAMSEVIDITSRHAGADRYLLL